MPLNVVDLSTTGDAMLAFGNSTFAPVRYKISRIFSLHLSTWHASKKDTAVFSLWPPAHRNHQT